MSKLPHTENSVSSISSSEDDTSPPEWDPTPAVTNSNTNQSSFTAAVGPQQLQVYSSPDPARSFQCVSRVKR